MQYQTKKVRQDRFIALLFTILDCVLLLATVFMLFAAISVPMGSLIVIFFLFVLLEIFFFNRGRRKYGMLKRAPFYYNKIMEFPLYTMDQVARVMRVSSEAARTEVSTLIEAGYITDVRFDHSENRVVLPGWESPSSDGEEEYEDEEYADYEDCGEDDDGCEYQEEETPAAPAYIRVICKNCGASNSLLEGSRGECEYCGSPLKA